MEIGVTQTIQKRLKNQDIHQPYDRNNRTGILLGYTFSQIRKKKCLASCKCQ